MTTDANSFLMGGGVQSAKFDKPGTVVKGIIDDFQLRDQTDFATGKVKTWDDGNPMKQLVVTLRTDERENEDDDGRRRIYIKGQMQQAVREAVQKAGADGLGIGGELAVKYVKDGEAKQRGWNPPKVYAARYTVPTMPVDDGGDPGEEVAPF